MMRKELEEIKREKMKKELEELKAESALKREPPRRYVERYTPKLSIPNVVMAAFSLLLAGYLIGTIYGYDVSAQVDNYLVSYSLPISGTLVIVIVSIVMAFIGVGLITVAKK
jgi:uncharacterized protein YacL